ncbi:MAG: hypothetical protein D6805_09515 [Planctomycetota bacterium]|nr:MAG: hypothetical protein D6805_09515 [Planctomycetota bacterium]
MSEQKVDLEGYCYRVNQDVVVSLIKRTVQDDLTLEEVVEKEILCNKTNLCGLAAESCPIVIGIIEEARKKRKKS